MKQRTLFITIFILFVSCGRSHEGFEAPDFTLPDIYGNNIRLYDCLDRGPVVIIPWALWCKICIKELDALKPYTDDLHSSTGVYFYAISQDKPRAIDQVKPFAESHEWIPHYLVLLDTANIIRDLYDIQAMPSTISIDQDGKIVFRWQGYHPGDELLITDSLKALFER